MECGDSETQKAVNKLMPQKVKKRRKVQTEEGVSKDCVGSFGAFLVFVNNSFLLVIVYIHAESSHGHHKIKIKKEAKANTLSNDLFCHQVDGAWEEFYDYIFPDEAASQPNIKLMALAKLWKKDQFTVKENLEEKSDQDNDNKDDKEPEGDEMDKDDGETVIANISK